MGTNPRVLTEADIDAIAQRVCEKLGQMPQKPKLLSIKAAAAIQGVSEGSLRHMVENETVPLAAVQRYGRRVFIVTERFEQWLESR